MQNKTRRQFWLNHMITLKIETQRDPWNTLLLIVFLLDYIRTLVMLLRSGIIGFLDLHIYQFNLPFCLTNILVPCSSYHVTKPPAIQKSLGVLNREFKAVTMVKEVLWKIYQQMVMLGLDFEYIDKRFVSVGSISNTENSTDESKGSQRACVPDSPLGV